MHLVNVLDTFNHWSDELSIRYLAVNLQVTRLFHDLLQLLVDLCTAKTEQA